MIFLFLGGDVSGIAYETEDLLQDMPDEFISSNNLMRDEASDETDAHGNHLTPFDFQVARDFPKEVNKDPPDDEGDPILFANVFEGDINNVTSVDINELLMTTNNARNVIRNKHQLWPNNQVS